MSEAGGRRRRARLGLLPPLMLVVPLLVVRLLVLPLPQGDRYKEPKKCETGFNKSIYVNLEDTATHSFHVLT